MGGYSTPFSGTFNGHGHVISNVQINDTTHENVGLIGVLTGTVENVGVNATVNTANAGFSVGVGGLVGREKSGGISDSYATGKVAGTANGNGGLVGLQDGGSISDSYAAALVSGGNYSGNGGLVGQQMGGTTIADSYATGAVSGGSNSNDGGLVGLQDGGSISDSYAAGGVARGTGSAAYSGGLVGAWFWQSAITNSFYDSQTTGQSLGVGFVPPRSTSGGVTGEATSAMKTEATFTGAGWDFTTTWGMQSSVNGGYPYLQATYAGAAALPVITRATYFGPGPAFRIGDYVMLGGAHFPNGATTVTSNVYLSSSGTQFAPLNPSSSGLVTGAVYAAVRSPGGFSNLFPVSRGTISLVLPSGSMAPGGASIFVATVTGANAARLPGVPVGFNVNAAVYGPFMTDQNGEATYTFSPPGAGTYAVTASVFGQTTTTQTLQVSLPATPAPSISSLSPAAGQVGTAVAIAGTHFGSSQGASTVYFGTTAAAVTSWSDRSITATVPGLAAGTANVTVNVGGKGSNALSFSVTAPPATAQAPSISSLSPAAGLSGTWVTIRGTHFGDSQGTSSVYFGTAAAVVTSWSDTSITAAAPDLATGPTDVAVSVGGMTSNAESFTLTSPPIAFPGNGNNGNNAPPVLPTLLVQRTVDTSGGTTTQTYGDTKVTVDVTPGAFASTEQMTLTTEDPTVLSSFLSQGGNPAPNSDLPGVPAGAVAVVLGVNFSGAAPTKPITVTIQNPSIPANALFYKLGLYGQLIPVQATVTAGQAVVTFTSDPDFVVLALQANQRVLTMAGQTQVLPSFVQKDPISRVMTTYMPIWYLMQALKANGLTSTWNGASWSLTTSGSAAVDLSNVRLGRGSMSISMNGTVVEHVPGTVAKDPLHGNKTTYMPIWYVFQVLQRLGMTSGWNGHTWTLSSPTSAK